MNKNLTRQWIVVLSIAAMIAVNILANALPLNGLDTGEISDRFVVYFVPAGYVFSIWGLIYLGLIAYAVFQVLPAQRENLRLAKIGLLTVVSCAANIAWLVCWHFEQFLLTLPVMLVLLGCLIGIYLRLGIGRLKVSTAERWAVHLPFSVYLGWITVATIANATQMLDFVHWNGWGIQDATWAVIMLIVATLMSGMVSYTRRDIAYSLVLVWAFAGIAIKQSAMPQVSGAAWMAAAVVAALVFLFAVLKLPHTTRAQTN